MDPMTAAEFEARVGVPPEGDELERANCPKAGEPGHRQCGVCTDCLRPRFACTCDYNVFVAGLPAERRAR